MNISLNEQDLTRWALAIAHLQHVINTMHTEAVITLGNYTINMVIVTHYHDINNN